MFMDISDNFHGFARDNKKIYILLWNVRKFENMCTIEIFETMGQKNTEG